MTTVLNVLMKHLKKWNVTHVFGIPGRPVVPLITEMVKHDITFVLARHETGAGYAAGGFALQKKTLGVAFATAGPGGTNMITSAGQAMAHNAPVLFLTGQISAGSIGKSYSQDSSPFGTDLVKMFEPVTKYSARVERGDSFENHFRHAMERAFTGVKGPVHLSLPLDVLLEEITPFDIDLPQAPQTIAANIEEAFHSIKEAKNPVFFLGKGIRTSDSYEEIFEIATRLSIPVITTGGGKGTFPTNHPLSLGVYGLGGTDEADLFLQSGIDVMIVAGSSLNDMAMAGFRPDFYPKKVIHFDLDPTFVGKTIPRPTLFVPGDLKENLKKILYLTLEFEDTDLWIEGSGHDWVQNWGWGHGMGQRTAFPDPDLGHGVGFSDLGHGTGFSDPHCMGHSMGHGTGFSDPDCFDQSNPNPEDALPENIRSILKQLNEVYGDLSVTSKSELAGLKQEEISHIQKRLNEIYGDLFIAAEQVGAANEGISFFQKVYGDLDEGSGLEWDGVPDPVAHLSTSREDNLFILPKTEDHPDYWRKNSSLYISSVSAIREIRRNLPEYSKVFADVGSHAYYAVKHFDVYQPDTFFFDDRFIAMGNGIGYAIGAKIAEGTHNHNLPIACITGDGCMQMHGTEIATAVEHRAPVLFFVFNNGGLDMVETGMKHWQNCPGHLVYNNPIDFVSFAKAVGCEGFRCLNEEDIEEAIKAGLQNELPTIIEIMVDPDEIPPTLKRDE